MTRHLFACLIALISLCLIEADAQTLRIATTQAAGPGIGAGDWGSADAQAARLEQIAAALRPADADLIVVGDIPDRTQALALVSILRPSQYHLAVFGAFTNATTERVFSGTITVLSRRPPFSARFAEWKSTGQIELPGGFGFAGFRSGTNAFCFYAAMLPADESAVMDRTGDTTLTRQRELAAQYLAYHAQWLNSTLSNHFTSFSIVANLVTEPASGHLENAGRILQQAGFNAWLAPGATDPGEHPRFSTFLARSAALRSAPTFLPQSGTRPGVCVYGINPGSVAIASTASNSTGRRTGTRTPNALVLWIWAGVIVGVCGVSFGIWRTVRRLSPDPAVFQSMADRQPAVDRNLDGREEIADEVGDSQTSGSEFGPSIDDSTARFRAGLMQQLRSLLGDRLIRWLSAQRGKLIASQDAGSQKVLEIEEHLQRIQGHFEVQLRNRDRRIRELEQEIQAREFQIRTLLRERAKPSDQSPAG